MVDIYATELRTLVGIEGEALEHLVLLPFITSLPDKVSVELQQTKDIEDLALMEIISRARVLVSNQGSDTAAVGAQSNQGQSNQDYRSPKCYECGGPHIARYCLETKKIRVG